MDTLKNNLNRKMSLYVMNDLFLFLIVQEVEENVMCANTLILLLLLLFF